MAQQVVAQASPIDTYVRSLVYDARTLLAVQPDGSTEAVAASTRSTDANAVVIVTKRSHTLRKNLSDIAVLRPTAGVIFPGAVVLADQNLMEGQPTPIALPRGKITISVDLPGLSESRDVPTPNNSSVWSAIVGLLAQWFKIAEANKYQNPARSYLEVTSAFTSQQLALDLGFNAKWATGDASAQLKVSDDSSTSTLMALYKQVFYTVSIDTPGRPSDFFAAEVALDDLKTVTGEQHPPAYIRSVDYGRLLMIKMTTTSSETNANLQGAFKMATGGTDAGGSLDAKYKQILKNSTFQALALGGSATGASNFTGSDDGLSKLKEYIQTDATFRPDNPGSPISYNVAFMKDNALATMGFTTDYTETERVKYTNGRVGLQTEAGYVGYFKLMWLEGDAQGNPVVQKDWASGGVAAPWRTIVDLPGDAKQVNISAWDQQGLLSSTWVKFLDETVDGPPNKGYKIYGTTGYPNWNTYDL